MKSQLYNRCNKNGYKCNDYFELQKVANLFPQLIAERKKYISQQLGLKLQVA